MPKPEINPDGSINWGNKNFNDNERAAAQNNPPAAPSGNNGAVPQVRNYLTPDQAMAGGAPAVAAAAGGSGGVGGVDPLAKLQADNAARQAANDAAEIAYRNATLAGARDDRAEAHAQQVWANTFAEKQAAFSQQQAQHATALGVLNLNAGLRGPSNYLTYLRTLSNTSGGLKDLVNGLAGQFQLSRQQGNVPGSGYERASVDTLVRDINAPPAGAADASGIPLPSGNQWNPRNFGILSQNPTQLGLAQNLYEESGRDWGTELSGYLSSLPKFARPGAGVALR